MPSVAACDPKFQRDDRGRFGQARYWRGPMWVNASWLVWLGLLRLGYASEAEELAARTAAAVRESGLREYYDPYDAGGMGQRHFGWSSLVMEMTDPDPRAASSYLEDEAPSTGARAAALG
jgi:glycogen debranching enzyme